MGKEAATEKIHAPGGSQKGQSQVIRVGNLFDYMAEAFYS